MDTVPAHPQHTQHRQHMIHRIEELPVGTLIIVWDQNIHEENHMGIIQLTLPVPPSVNTIWRVSNGRMVKSAKYREWLSCCDLAALQSRIPRPSIKKPVSVDVVVRTGHGWNRSRDIDNLLKPILDWLVRWDILSGDDCGVVRQIHLSIDPRPQPVACIEVTISPL